MKSKQNLDETARGVSVGKAKKDISKSLVIRTVPRHTADIGVWRSALISADNGYRKKLYDLYKDILLDNVLSDAIEKRIEAITNSEIKFNVNDKPVPEMDTFMETHSFETIITEIINSKFWGYSVIELDPKGDGTLEANLIPRDHVHPVSGIITREWYDTNGWSFLDNPFFLTAGDPKDHGLILKACPYAIYKRGGFGDFAQFVEIFGQPFRVGKYDAYDDDTRKALFEALVEAGSDAVAVIPKEGNIEFHESKSTSNGQLHVSLKDACNEEILIGILGQTMTTTSGSSRSQGEVHMEVQKSKHKADRRFVTRILNDQLLPFLVARGWPVEGGKFTIPEKGENIALKDRIEIDMKVAEKVPVPSSYFYQTYGIPMPKQNEDVVFNPTQEITPKAESGSDFFD